MIGLSKRQSPQLICVQRFPSSLLTSQIPANTKAISRLVVFTLNEKLRATLIKPKYRVVKVQPRCEYGKPLPEIVASLSIHLEMRKQIDISPRTFDSAGRRCAIRLERHEPVTENVSPVVSHPNPS